jgi:hypothetical protein
MSPMYYPSSAYKSGHSIFPGRSKHCLFPAPASNHRNSCVLIHTPTYPNVDVLLQPILAALIGVIPFARVLRANRVFSSYFYP